MQLLTGENRLYAYWCARTVGLLTHIIKSGVACSTTCTGAPVLGLLTPAAELFTMQRASSDAALLIVRPHLGSRARWSVLLTRHVRWWRGAKPAWWTHSTRFIDLGFPPEMLIGFEPGSKTAHRFSNRSYM